MCLFLKKQLLFLTAKRGSKITSIVKKNAYGTKIVYTNYVATIAQMLYLACFVQSLFAAGLFILLACCCLLNTIGQISVNGNFNLFFIIFR